MVSKFNFLLILVLFSTFHLTFELNILKPNYKKRNILVNKLNMNVIKPQSLDLKLREAESKKIQITISQDGNSNFTTITEALSSIQLQNTRRVILLIGPGVYREKIVIPKTLPFITFLGDATNLSVISWNDSSSTIGSDGHPLGTFNTPTVAVNADYFIAINITFENSASYFGKKVEQAVALRISGNKAAFYGCSFFGVQDTLYDHKGLHFFKNCFIEGAIDFIFGFGRSLYEECTINSIATNIGYITAQKRSSSSLDTGFSFKKCEVKGSGHIYLGRPWGEYSRVIYSYTNMKEIVLPKGWEDTMNGTHYPNTIYYGEYKCSGPGSNFSGRAPWARNLTDEEAQPFIEIHFIEGETWLINPN
ncbi:probable pectinesterase 53 [Lathyrus oleraceus]|uniref:probable pectinesterase 53 n=1 Tax=Pisum sativum TaxID=3888 RepID=UPI0021CE0C0B|nr:probable pectinesterase 53 [Pisum sativum]XP_050891798.1 probable pectinesterase 53 [Pisum sativum]